jgi:predicted DNA binding protein
MSVVARIDVPARAFVLEEALDLDAETSVRLERVVPVEDPFVPYLWVTSESLPAVKRALAAAQAVESFEIVETVDDESLVHAAWCRPPNGVGDLVTDAGGVLLDAVGEDGTWRLGVRFPTRDDLSAFYQACDERGIAVELRSVTDPEPPGVTPGCLTDAQRHALTTAFEMGYFEVPRRATLDDIARELDISDSAVSQRLRRGVGALLTQTFGDGVN